VGHVASALLMFEADAHLYGLEVPAKDVTDFWSVYSYSAPSWTALSTISCVNDCYQC
jgi:hypothetical protein